MKSPRQADLSTLVIMLTFTLLPLAVLLLAAPALALDDACVAECHQVCSAANSLCFMDVLKPGACANAQAQCEQGCSGSCSCLNGCASSCLAESCADGDLLCKSRSAVCMGKCPAQCSAMMAQMVLESAAHSDNAMVAQAAQNVAAASQQVQQMLNAVVSQVSQAEQAYTQNVQKMLDAGASSEIGVVAQIATSMSNNFNAAQEYVGKLAALVVGQAE